jgi:hypothetical protein
MKSQINKFRVVILCCVLLCATFAAKAQFSGGAGTSGNPYLITTATDLNQVRNYLAASFKLMDDVNAGSAWVPIGSNSSNSDASRFTGNFDGNGHTITINGVGTVPLVTVISYNYYYVGLFGYVGTGATIQNLKVAGSVTFNAGGNFCNMGGIAGRNEGGTISNCVAAQNIVLTLSADIMREGFAGGIAGVHGGTGTIQTC